MSPRRYPHMSTQNGNGNGATTPPNGSAPKDAEFRALAANLIMHRAELMRQSLEPGRDLDKDCNYPDEPTPSDYQKLYDRLGPATRVVQVYPRECWQVQPTVYEDEDPDVITTFEEAWDELGQGLRSDRSFYQDEAGSPVWEYLLRADELSGVGQYGAILLGLNDGLPLNEPAQFVGPAASILRDSKGKSIDEPTQNYRRKLLGSKKPGARRKGIKLPPAPHKARLTFNQPAGQGRRLTFIRIFPETAATISKFDEDLSSPRFGQPTEYSLTFASPVEVEGRSVNSSTVHWTRIIHVADNLAANEIFGVPRQKPVYNNLLDLRKLYGGSAEMYWRGAFPGYALESLPQFGTEVDYDEEKINSMMFKWSAGLQRHLLLTGLSMKGLSPQVVDPRSQIEVHIEAICIQLGIPVRVFKGTERGELASSQDDAAWNDRLRQRQSGYLTPRLIVPFVDRLIALGVLPAPAGYSVWWPDLTSQSEQEQGDIAALRTTSVVQYADSAGARGVIAPHDYWTRIQGYSEEEAASIVDAAEKERKRLEAEKKKAEEEALAQQTALLDQQRQAAEAKARANGTPPPGGPPQAEGGGNTPPGGNKPPRTPIANYSPTQARDEHGRFLSGGGSYTPEQVQQAKEKLAKMPAEEKQYKHFPDDPRDEIEMKQFGFQGRRNAKGGAVPNWLDEPKKFKEVELDPSKVKIHNVQANVIRDEVAKKLDQGRSADRPVVIKHGDEYTLVDGNHRAAADVLATGKLIALVTERTGKNKFKAPTVNAFCPTGPGGGIDPTCSPGGHGPPGPAVAPPGSGHHTNGGGTTEPLRPNKGRPGAAKDLVHDATDWKVVGDWQPAGSSLTGQAKWTGDSDGKQGAVAKNTIGSLPASWSEHLSGTLREMHIGEPPPPYTWATYLYDGGKGVMYARPAAMEGQTHDIQIVHEAAHALDASTGYKLSEIPAFKNTVPTKYAAEVKKSGQGHPGHESYAEVVAMYSYPKGRQYLQEKYPEAYAAAHQLFTKGPSALLGGTGPTTAGPVKVKAEVPQTSTPQKKATAPPNTAPPRTPGKGPAAGTKVSVLELTDLDTKAGVGWYTGGGARVKAQRRLRAGTRDKYDWFLVNQFGYEIYSSGGYLPAHSLAVVVDEVGDGDGLIINVFCPTGPGGGIDPSCGKWASQGGSVRVEEWGHAHGHIFHAEINGKSVGRAKLYESNSMSELFGKPSFYVSGLHVKDEYRRQGAAKAIYLKILEHTGDGYLVPDFRQTAGASSLWKSLSSLPHVETKEVQANGVTYKGVRLRRPSVLQGNARAVNAFCPTGPGGGIDPTCSPGSKKIGGVDRAVLERDLREAAKPDSRTGLGPTVPALFDKLKKKHPQLTEPEFHAFLKELRDRGDVTLQLWDTSVPIERSGYPEARFPKGGRLGVHPIGWVVFNAFCSTGPGGGIDPHCSPNSSRVGPAAGGSGNNRQMEKFEETDHVPIDLLRAGQQIRDNKEAAASVARYTRDKTEDGTPVHVVLNQKLRSGQELSQDDKALVSELDKITRKEFDSPVTVYRGLGASSGKFLENARSALEAGGTLQDNGFGSTSLNPRVASTAFSQFGVVCQVEVRRGAYLEPSTQYGGEHEVLLARGSRFRVVGIDDKVKIGGVKEYTVIRLQEE